MDFDHRDPRTKTFALAAGGALLKRREVLLDELAKCDVVCAHCHSLRTFAALLERRRQSDPEDWAPGTSPHIARKRERWRANARMLDRIRDVPCADCSRRFPPCAMQFDHRDGTAKMRAVTRTINRSPATILAEVAKCDIVCANCHRDRTYRRRSVASSARE